MLGRELAAYLRREKLETVGWDLPEYDITDIEATINGIHRVGPDVIFHLAAWTDVDGCELDPTKATKVNFQGTWAVALGAAEAGCKLVYVSTDYVFDGQKGKPYREKDTPNPESAYGRTKLMGEKSVGRTCKRGFIARTSWLYGQHGKNFVDMIRGLAQERDRLEVVEDQVGSPTWARDLCAPLLRLAQSDKFGIYHLTGSGHCSWFELAKEIVRRTGAQCEVAPIATERANRPAPRPAFSVLENRELKTRLGRVFRPGQEALEEYLGEVSTAQLGS
jgi:dTDP-4-dehydrorhamnose reductase